MPDLVALDLPGGPPFVGALVDTWERGDAVCPLDPRLPPAARARVLDELAPTAIIGPDGVRRPLEGGRTVEPGDALVVATSGSTGAPKGVVLSRDAVAASARAGSDCLDVDPGADRWLACLPLSQLGVLGVVTRAVLTGTMLELHDGFDAVAVIDAARRGATLTTVVPTTLARIDPAAFRRVVVGGADVPDVLPANVTASYGLTETCGGLVYDGVPFHGCEVRLRDGEILVRGPVLLRAYRDGTVPLDEDGWLATGDGGRFDADGRLVVEGRLSDLVITGGENVWPAPVEEILAGDPAIAAAAVVGRPDPEWGERIVAIVQLCDGAEPPTLAAVRGRVREQLPAYAAPKELVVVDAVPLTASGKVNRRAARALLP